MLGVLANNHYFAFSFDDLALLADLLNGWFHLHCSYHSFLALNFGSTLRISQILFCTPGDASLGQVINRNLNGHAIAGENADIVHAQLTRDVGGHHVTVGQAHLEGGVGESLHNLAFKLNDIILRHEEFPLLCI